MSRMRNKLPVGSWPTWNSNDLLQVLLLVMNIVVRTVSQEDEIPEYIPPGVKPFPDGAGYYPPQEILPCDSNPCQHRSLTAEQVECVNLDLKKHACECPEGHNKKNNCKPKTCTPGDCVYTPPDGSPEVEGRCKTGSKSYKCTCPKEHDPDNDCRPMPGCSEGACFNQEDNIRGTCQVKKSAKSGYICSCGRVGYDPLNDCNRCGEDENEELRWGKDCKETCGQCAGECDPENGCSQCVRGFKGSNCDKIDCKKNPCGLRGECVKKHNRCRCKPQFTGKLCQTKLTKRVVNYNWAFCTKEKDLKAADCKNGGTCLVIKKQSDLYYLYKKNKYQCKCQGTEVHPHPQCKRTCDVSSCLNGNCVKAPGGGKEKVCSCNAGYVGEHCDQRCPEGLWGKDCETTCGTCAKAFGAPQPCDARTGHCPDNTCDPESGAKPPLCLGEGGGKGSNSDKDREDEAKARAVLSSEMSISGPEEALGEYGEVTLENSVIEWVSSSARNENLKNAKKSVKGVKKEIQQMESVVDNYDGLTPQFKAVIKRLETATDQKLENAEKKSGADDGQKLLHAVRYLMENVKTFNNEFILQAELSATDRSKAEPISPKVDKLINDLVVFSAENVGNVQYTVKERRKRDADSWRESRKWRQADQNVDIQVSFDAQLASFGGDISTEVLTSEYTSALKDNPEGFTSDEFILDPESLQVVGVKPLSTAKDESSLSSSAVYGQLIAAAVLVVGAVGAAAVWKSRSSSSQHKEGQKEKKTNRKSKTVNKTQTAAEVSRKGQRSKQKVGKSRTSQRGEVSKKKNKSKQKLQKSNTSQI